MVQDNTHINKHQVIILQNNEIEASQVFVNEESARRALAVYCRVNWEDETVDYSTLTDDEVVAAWLDNQSNNYSLNIRQVGEVGGDGAFAGKPLFDIADEDAAARMERHVLEAAIATEQYASMTGLDFNGEETETAVKDLLASMMHFCDARGIEFDAVLDGARMHHEDEVAEAQAEGELVPSI